MQANSRDDLREQLTAVEAGGVFFTTINKVRSRCGQTSVPVLRAPCNVVDRRRRRTVHAVRLQSGSDTKTGQTSTASSTCAMRC